MVVTPTGSTKSCPEEADGFKSCPDTQTAGIHIQNIEKNSNRPVNMSVRPDLPVRGAEPQIGRQKRPRNQMGMSDTHACMEKQLE